MELWNKFKGLFGLDDRPKKNWPPNWDPRNPPDQWRFPDEFYSKIFDTEPREFVFSFGNHNAPHYDHERYEPGVRRYDDNSEDHPNIFFFGHQPPGFFSPFGGQSREEGDDDEFRGEHGTHHPFHSEPNDMFRHFEDMFRGFDELFRSMGIADFSPHHQPSVGWPTEPPRSERDRMLKQPNRDTGTGPSDAPGVDGSLRGHSPGQDRRTGPSVMDRLFTTPDWDEKTHQKIDNDLDEAIKSGDFSGLLGPQASSKSPRTSPNPPPVSPRLSPGLQDKEGSAQSGEYRKRVSVRTYRNVNGNEEERQCVEDGRGGREDRVTRTLDGQTHTVITKTDPSGQQHVEEAFTNMDAGQKGEFDQRWQWRAGSGPLRVNPRYEALLKDNMDATQKETTSDFRRLFRLSFRGFPSARDEERR